MTRQTWPCQPVFVNGQTGSRAGHWTAAGFIATKRTMRIQDWKGEIGGIRWWTRALGLAVFMGIVLGVFGPFGSYLNGNVLLRIFSWCGNLIMGTVVVGVTIPLVTQGALRLGLPRLAGVAIGMVVAALPAAILSARFGHWLWPYAVGLVKPEEWYAQALMVEGFILVIWVLVSLAAQSWRQPAAETVAQAVVANGPVLCLQMEDHYVRVHRASGSSLELLTLNDAMTRYSGGKGLQVHRSWWVASSAVTGLEREGRNLRLRLSNGLAVPVARNRVTEVRVRGWIESDVG